MNNLFPYFYNQYIKRNKHLHLTIYLLMLIAFLIPCSMYLFKNADELYLPYYDFWFLNKNYMLIINIFLYLIPLIIPLFLAKPCFQENDNITFFVLRSNRKNFYFIKSILCFLIPFFVVLFFLLCSFIFTKMMTFGLDGNYTNLHLYEINDPNGLNIWVLFPKILMNHPNLFNIIYIVLISLYAGLNGLMFFIVSSFIKNKIMASCIPFAFSIFLIYILGFISKRIVVWYPQNLFHPQPALSAYAPLSDLLIGIAFFTLMIFILTIISNIILWKKDIK